MAARFHTTPTGSSLRATLSLIYLFILGASIFVGAQPRDILFAGMTWGLRSTAGPSEPGPNVFSNRNDQVWVDEKGRLHLTVQKRGDIWTASEVMAKRDTGYGTYRCSVSGALKALDPSIVFGFFTWDNKALEAFNREIDFEIARWGVQENPDGWFTVQPYTVPGNQHSFVLPDANSYTFEIIWLKDSVEFKLILGDQVTEHWTYTKNVPAPGRARLRINLWLHQGREPRGPGPYEVIVSELSYIPN